jgi:hypothetical protein
MTPLLHRTTNAWQALCALKLRGPWRPGAHNIVVLVVQIAAIWGAAQRGMDYVQSAGRNVESLSGIEASVPLQWLGLSFLLPAGIAFFGLASGWARPLVIGHLLIGTSYLVLGITYLRQSKVENVPMAVGGSLLLLLSAFLLVTAFRKIPDAIALSTGMAAMVAGGWLAAKGLGFGYRTGNGFLVGAVYHFAFGFGTQVMAHRERVLAREDEDDLAALKASL